MNNFSFRSWHLFMCFPSSNIHYINELSPATTAICNAALWKIDVFIADALWRQWSGRGLESFQSVFYEESQSNNKGRKKKKNCLIFKVPLIISVNSFPVLPSDSLSFFEVNTTRNKFSYKPSVNFFLSLCISKAIKSTRGKKWRKILILCTHGWVELVNIEAP